MIRMIDIAREAGVSRPQVSAVLSGKPTTIGVSAKKAAEIRAIAEKYHYQPNVMARALRGKSTKTIGVLQDSHASPSNFRILGALENVLASYGYRMLAGEGHADPAIHLENYLTLRQYGVDGVFCLSHDYPGEYDRLLSMFKDEKNLVFIGLPQLGNCPTVYSDVAAGVRKAAEYLLKTGRKRPGLVYIDTGSAVMAARKQGFLTGCPGGENRVLALPFQKTESSHAEMAVQELVERKKCDALIAYNDVFALQLLNVFHTKGIRVPDDVALVGQDNNELSAYTIPSLTTIAPDLHRVAEESMQVLLSLMKGEKPENRVITPELVVRKST